MKKMALSVLVFFLFLLACAGMAAAAQDRDHKPDLVVDDDKVQCPAATFTSIQDAINAANSGNLIRVCAGIYREQLSIDKSLSVEGDNGAVVMPNSVVANATGSSGHPMAAVILVREASNVEIEGLIVDAANNGIGSCDPDLVGILYQNSSGIIEHNAVRNTKLAAALNGCQSGDGIVVQSLAGAASTVSVEDNSIHDYQKNGITGNEAGTQVTISDNVVTGVGPTTGAAQNGIQIGFGGKGSVLRNIVTGNIYAPCVSLADCSFNATGILVFEADDVVVEHNTVASNQVGIYAGGKRGAIDGNNIADSRVHVGIDLAGDNNVARRNDVTNSAEAAILVEGNDNRVVDNELTEAPVGILKLSGTVGNTHSGNSFFDDLVKVMDPDPQHLVHVAPHRR